MKVGRYIALLIILILLALMTVQARQHTYHLRRELAQTRRRIRESEQTIQNLETDYIAETTPEKIVAWLHDVKLDNELVPMQDAAAWVPYDAEFIHTEDGAAVRLSLLPPAPPDLAGTHVPVDNKQNGRDAQDGGHSRPDAGIGDSHANAGHAPAGI